MNLKQCFLTANSCYKKGTKMQDLQPTGIVVHSTGANNPYLKRYVQPLTTDANYQEVLEDLGTNSYGNHWNQSGTNTCVHAFIGKTATEKIATYQTLPFTYCCWGCGSGQKGSYNNNPQARIQFEICEDGLTDETYFTAVFQEAAEFCAYLCKQYNLTVNEICSHAEAYKAGYGTNHEDVDRWLKNFDKTMDDFRSAVKELLEEKEATPVSQYKPGIYQVIVNSLNRRIGPGAGYDIAGTALGKGDRLNVTKIENNAWGYAENLKAWVNVSDVYCKYLGVTVVEEPKKEPTVGDLVKVDGNLYSNKNGGKATKVNQNLYITKIYASGSYPYALSKTKGGTTYGYGNKEVLQ